MNKINNLSNFYPKEGRSIQCVESLLTERQASALLGVTIRCLQAWRYRGGGPRFIKISNRCVRYRPSDLQQFIEDRVRTSTSDPGEGGAA